LYLYYMPQQPISGRPATAASAQATNAGPAVTASESKIRLTAFFVLVIAIVYLIGGYGIAPLFLLLDFTLRSFGLPRYSPLGYLAGTLATALKLPVKPVFLPPKRFAARVGFVFCLAITILHYANQEIAATILGAVLAIFAALESLAGFCAGCYVYNAWARLRAN
jgi:Domain of unknown function (DUF4395)